MKCPKCKAEIVVNAEKIERFLLEWGRQNSAFQKNEGFRRKVAQAIKEEIEK